MAFAVAALSGDGESVIHGAEAASVSFPEFWETLGKNHFTWLEFRADHGLAAGHRDTQDFLIGGVCDIRHPYERVDFPPRPGEIHVP